MNEITLVMEHEHLTPKIVKLRAKWTIETRQDLCMMGKFFRKKRKKTDSWRIKRLKK